MPHTHKCTSCGAEWVCDAEECETPEFLVCNECALEATDDYDRLDEADADVAQDESDLDEGDFDTTPPMLERQQRYDD